MELIKIHQKPIRDIRASPRNDGLILTASLDKTLKVTSVLSNNTVLTYQLDQPAWSCCWNYDYGNRLYCGLQNNVVLEFDLRNTSGAVKRFRGSDRASGPPIHSLDFVHLSQPPGTAESPSVGPSSAWTAILAGDMQGPMLFDLASEGVGEVPAESPSPIRLFAQADACPGACTSVCFDQTTDTCLSVHRNPSLTKCWVRQACVLSIFLTKLFGCTVWYACAWS